MSIKSVKKACEALELLAEADGGMGVVQLSQLIETSPASMHQLLQTLKECGFVRQERSTKRYTLGPRLFDLASRSQRELRLAEIAEPYVRAVASRTGESAHLSVLSQDEALHIVCVESQHLVRVSPKVGRRVPLYASAVGKVLLAGLSDGELERTLLGLRLERFTPNTVGSMAELRAEIERVRILGHGIDNEEYEQGGVCMAIPVRGQGGRVVAAISIALPKVRVERLPDLELLAVMRMEAANLSHELGSKGDPIHNS